MKIFLLISTLFFAFSGQADVVKARWTGKDDTNAQFEHVLEVANKNTGLALTSADFILVEERDLANNHFKMYSQVVEGLVVRGAGIRIWSTISNAPQLIQAEAFLQAKKALQKMAEKLQLQRLREETFDLYPVVKNLLKTKPDNSVHGMKVTEVWINGEPTKLYMIKGKYGKHSVAVSLLTQKVVEYKYSEFPQGDLAVQVFPIYEEVESNGHIQKRIPATLKYLNTDAIRAVNDPYSILRSRHYFEDKFDSVMGNTEEGRKLGYWSMDYLKNQAAIIRNKIRTTPNTFANGMILEGRFATVSLHPDILKNFSGLNFAPMTSAQFMPRWTRGVPPGQTDPMYEMIPGGALLGRPLMSADEAWNRPARRLPDHNPVEYINDGFDELQVYYGITTLMDSLRSMGFTDPDLSTRPFNAFLYDPDIEMRDNAYYSDDTINFTTYSPQNVNYARDNSTIWHELGHGIMDRLMGDSIQLADTGGLSEGMADFVAALVIADVTDNMSFEGSDEFRIINNTGFNLTNEVHDDGEAYGGSMKDLLDLAMRDQGREGLKKVTDLTLEAMRLSRNHPALTASDWFNHMLFADELGHEGVRKPGELSPYIIQALNGRNFSLDGKAVANFKLMNGEQDVVSGSPGSRENPVPVNLAPTEKSTFHLNINLKESEHYKFNFPTEVKLFFRGGPLQGAIKWEGEESGPITRVIKSENDVASLDVIANGTCDFVNQGDGSCKDYVYVQVFSTGSKKPIAKKRFYLKVRTKAVP